MGFYGLKLGLEGKVRGAQALLFFTLYTLLLPFSITELCNCDQSCDMCGNGSESDRTGCMADLASDVFLPQMVLIVVVEDDVYFLAAQSADVWTEHDQVGRLSVHLDLVQSAGEELHVSTAAVEALLVFDAELDDESLAFVAERTIKLRRNPVESQVLRRLQTYSGTRTKFTLTLLTNPKTNHTAVSDRE